MADLKNEFSWSISQSKEFAECKRSYYYSRYGSWEGWPTGKGDKRAKEIYLLKKLTGKEMWVGSVVHDVIKNILENLKNGYSIDYEDIENRLIKIMRADINSSKQKLYHQDPKNKVGFFEDEYEIPISDGVLDDLIEFAVKCIQNFLNSEAFLYLKNVKKDQWLTIDENRPSSFVFEGTIVYAKIDAALIDSGKLIIYDWKTGRKEDVDYSLQLACYLTYASKKWNFRPSDIELFEVNVATGKITKHVGSATKIDWFENYIRNGIAATKSLLKDSENNIAAEEDFDKVNTLRYCKYCNYLRICKPAILPDGKPN